jgi:CO/xanthine dehydrogenase FAD-binding subunit
MDLKTVTSVVRPKTRSDLPIWTSGDAWLAGGTWLFSEPQSHLNRLIDLQQLGWPSLQASDRGLEIAATCPVAALDAFVAPKEWRAVSLIGACCRAFLASFKIWKTATVGGNICMSLPAGPMISLTAALDGVCTIWSADGSEREVNVLDFVTGNQSNVLGAGDLLRKIDLPADALHQAVAFRQISLTPVGRSAALLIGTLRPDNRLSLTVTASTTRPYRLSFQDLPTAERLRDAIVQQIPEDAYHNDVHGKPEWRQQMTLLLADEILAELRASVGA